MSLELLKKELEAFTKERNWGRFHNAKNFAAAICSESGELMDHFVWMNDADADDLKNNPEKLKEVKKEAADILINLIQFSRHLDFDLEQEAWAKLEKIKKRYPAKECRESVTHMKKPEVIQ